MELIGLKINEYLDVLKSGEPTPGGGSASALIGAQGMALLIMACDLTLGREKYSEYFDVCRKTKVHAQIILSAIVKHIDDDAKAYNMLFNAYKMPKETESDKQSRTAAINAGTEASIRIPMSVMNLAHEGLQLISGLAGKINPNTLSDLGVAALNLSSCIKGAWLNVKINLPGIADETLAKHYHSESENLYHDSDKIADEVFRSIVNEMA